MINERGQINNEEYPLGNVVMIVRLTRAAERIAQSRVASPVIIKTKRRSIESVLDIVSPYVEELKSIFPRLQQFTGPNVAPFSSPLRVLRRFDMISSYLPREVIFTLAETKYVDRIYADTPMWAMYPRLPQEGIYEASHRITRDYAFTSTYWTKAMMGCDIGNKQGFNGEDTTVSVIDTGASRVHSQIRGIRMKSTMAQQRDENGHGSWCATCIGGTRAVDRHLSRASGKEVLCEGMAPRADILAIKALGFFVGVGSTSNILEAIEKSIDLGAHVMSMSLGGPPENDNLNDDPYNEAMNKAIDSGIIPVVAAGNSGPDKSTIDSPGYLPQVLTVGAYNPINGKMASFSGRGPTHLGDTKPDVIAPGVNVDSGIAGILDTSGDGFPSRYSPISGTSMATPHVAGLITMMCQAHRSIVGADLTVEEIKDMMDELGKRKNNTSGWGIITWQIYEEWLSTEYGQHTRALARS